MSAIVTEHFRRNNAASFLADIADATNNYYLGIGKSDRWATDEGLISVVPTPNGTAGEERDILSNLITCLKISAADTTLAIPNVVFEIGKKYKAYDPNDSSCFYPTINGLETIYPCYATVGGRIYLCLNNNDTAETADVPVVNDNYSAIKNTDGDGYVWILLDADATNFNTNQFISVRSTPNEQKATQIDNQSGGLLYGFSVLNGGSGYSDGPVTFYATQDGNTDQIEITCNAITSGGIITAVTLPSLYSYTNSTALNITGGTFTSLGAGSGAVVVPNIAPAEGFAYEPSRTLPAWFAAISIDAVGNISDDGLFIPFRQISVIKNLGIAVGVTPTSTLAALRYLVLSGAPTAQSSTGDIITFDNGSRAFYDSYALVSGQHRVYFHQNSVSGTGLIPDSGDYTIPAGSNSYTSVVSVNEYIPNSGDVVFTENRLPVFRQSGQTEEIKIIIQF